LPLESVYILTIPTQGTSTGANPPSLLPCDFPAVPHSLFPIDVRPGQCCSIWSGHAMFDQSERTDPFGLDSSGPDLALSASMVSTFS